MKKIILGALIALIFTLVGVLVSYLVMNYAAVIVIAICVLCGIIAMYKFQE